MKIIEFTKQYTEELIALILDIQINEFAINITRNEQPDLEIIDQFYQINKGNFWIALLDGKVVGSIGLIDIGNSNFALRKMFVHKEYRGSNLAIAQQLLNQAFLWSANNNIKQIYLGTTSSYKAAHRFYEKNNFKKTAKEELPNSFPLVHVDTIFYCFTLV